MPPALYNNSNEAIARIHVSPPSAGSYGTTNLLGDGALPPGYNAWVDPGLVPDSQNECLLDVIAIGVNGGKWQKRFDVCEQSRWTLIGGTGPKTIQ